MLTKSEVTKKVKEYINQVINTGKENEEPKLDYKFEWHKLKPHKKASQEERLICRKQKNKFCKILGGIANTLGGDGFIIFGFDSKRKVFNNVSFLDSGLNDSNELDKFIYNNFSHHFDVVYYPISCNGHNLDVLYIPPTKEKPYLVTDFYLFDKNTDKAFHLPNQIFIRNGTSTNNANRREVNNMYRYRESEKNTIPEYDVKISVINLNSNPNKSNLNSEGKFHYHGRFSITLENTGLRPICIKRICFHSPISENGLDFHITQGARYNKNDGGFLDGQIYNIVFHHGEMKIISFNVISSYYKSEPVVSENNNWNVEIELTTGKILNKSVYGKLNSKHLEFPTEKDDLIFI